jgi:hypothetical protein
MTFMTASFPGGGQVTITAAWPHTAHVGARVSNIHLYQWDQERTGLYLIMGHIGLPIWETPDDRVRWEEDHPDHRVAVETLGTFYMTEQVARDLCEGLVAHLGLTVVEKAPGAAT